MYTFLRTVILISIITALRAENKSETRVTSFAETFASILAVFSGTGVLAVVSPVLLKFAFIPLFTIIKLLSKPLIYMGLTGYLMVALTPLILAKSGMTSPAFTYRSGSDDWMSSINHLLSSNMKEIASKTLSLFKIDSEECKMQLSCKIGKRVANNHPYINFLLIQSGARNWVEDKYLANMVRSMTDSSNCENICESLASEDDISNASTTMSSKLHSNLPSSLDTINEIVEWFGKK